MIEIFVALLIFVLAVIAIAILMGKMEIEHVHMVLPEPPKPAAHHVVWEAARKSYNRYGDSVEWKAVSGNPMPVWEDLPFRIQKAWMSAVAPMVMA